MLIRVNPLDGVLFSAFQRSILFYVIVALYE